MKQMTRRQFLGSSAGAMAAGLIPASLQRVMAAPAVTGTMGSIAHVVIISQENRSFDNYFGSLAGVRGFADSHPLTLQGTSRNVFQQADLVGLSPITPWHFDVHNSAAMCLYDLPHDSVGENSAWNGGRLNNWRTLGGDGCMGFFNRGDIPFHYALADAFTVCDHYHAPLRNMTDPNRVMLMTGTIDPNGLNGGPYTNNSINYSTPASSALRWTTYPERLQAAGISWSVYHEGNCESGCAPLQDDYGDNALGWFAQYKTASADSPLYINGIQGRNTAQFVRDCLNDTLPAVSWVFSPAILSEHPGQWANGESYPQGSPVAGAWWVSQYLSALAANPAVWAKTLVILTYDENGGFYDHVPPPTPIAGTPDEFISGSAIGMGFRVPTLLCSPWSRGGNVASETFDHTSVLQFLEQWTGVAEPNISQWRRKVAGDLTSAFNFSVDPTTVSIPALLDTVPLMNATVPECNKSWPSSPSSTLVVPPQEAGQRALTVQPYALDCWLTQDLANGEIWYNWINLGSKTAAFQVNVNQYRSDGPWFYNADPGVAGRDYMHVVTWGGGYYDIEMHGPNQFFRRFKGYLNASAWQGQMEPSIRLATAGTGTPVTITFSNPTRNTAQFNVEDRLAPDAALGNYPVKVAPGATLALSFPTQQDWYDFTVTLSGSSNFLQMLAGHVEGGYGAVTRPALQR